METILSIRLALGMSQSEMADMLDLHQSTISRFERGELPVDKRTMLAANALLAARKATRATRRGEAA
ncbi:MAG: helix-turn-helix domain-containing protein [Novosphingobium sp.]|jgi:transcriptional regulator with XRE-family HTH domain|nr:helix-turn-helix domain-containing protein [Novosphingobium sp.]